MLAVLVHLASEGKGFLGGFIEYLPGISAESLGPSKASSLCRDVEALGVLEGTS